MSWEYRHLDDENPHQFVIKANELGVAGWELSALFLEHGWYIGIFKRPAPFAALSRELAESLAAQQQSQQQAAQMPGQPWLKS